MTPSISLHLQIAITCELSYFVPLKLQKCELLMKMRFFFLWQPTGKNWAWMIMSISTSGRVDVKNNLSIYACRTFQILKTVYTFPSTSQVWATSWILCKILILDTEVCGCNIRKFDKRLLGCKYFSKSLAELSGFTYLVIHGSSRAGLHLDVWLWSEELHMINKPK